MPSKPPMSDARASSAASPLAAEGWVAEVVAESGGVDKVRITTQGLTDLPGDLGHFEVWVSLVRGSPTRPAAGPGSCPRAVEWPNCEEHGRGRGRTDYAGWILGFAAEPRSVRQRVATAILVSGHRRLVPAER